MAATTDRDLMEKLVTERWHMLTMDTEVDPQTGIGSSTTSEGWNTLAATLEHMAARLAGDGFEGEPDTREVVTDLMDTIGERLIAFGVAHRLDEIEDSAGKADAA